MILTVQELRNLSPSLSVLGNLELEGLILRSQSLCESSLGANRELVIKDYVLDKVLSLNKIGVLNYSVCGDSRFDRVIEIRNNFKSILFFDEFCGKNKILIAGSTWPKDEELLINSFMALNEPNLKLILVPLPPLAEQKRIVTKVDKLMKLCDELETKLTQTQTEREKIINAAVKQLLTV